jgi:hypothetical protein
VKPGENEKLTSDTSLARRWITIIAHNLNNRVEIEMNEKEFRLLGLEAPVKESNYAENESTSFVRLKRNEKRYQ